MARAPNEKVPQAKALFDAGEKLVDIAKKLDLPEGTVRRWKSSYGWGKKQKKQNERSETKKTNARNKKEKQNKRGAPLGNKNAVGNSGGGAPFGNQNSVKHGGYRPVFLDALDEEEQELFNMISDDEEIALIEEIRLLSIRERRILRAIQKCNTNAKNGMTIIEIDREEEKRTFDNPFDKELYDRMLREKVERGERLPGNRCLERTQVVASIEQILRLEKELTGVQKQKTKAIAELAKIREARNAGNNGSKELIDDWISGVMGGSMDE